jgi:hypothetical protein
MLWAPDIAVGEIPDQPGWVKGVPSLAVEYADTGQDEGELAAKIEDLLAAGTRYVWVVRLTGPRRVEVHAPGKSVSLAHPGEQLQAPGILANPVPVEALYDRELAREVVLRNLLQREGYASLEEVQAAGEVQGLQGAILEVLAARGLAVDDALRAAIEEERDVEVLKTLLRQAAIAGSAAAVLAVLRATRGSEPSTQGSGPSGAGRRF